MPHARTCREHAPHTFARVRRPAVQESVPRIMPGHSKMLYAWRTMPGQPPGRFIPAFQRVHTMIPNTLSIAGVDPSGGAGILADVKTMMALGAYGCALVAALTAQNTQAVTDILPVAPEFVGRQIDTLFADVRIDAVKIGMLGQAPVTRVVAERLAHWKPAHVVLDPVMVAKSGDHLLERSAVHELRESLLPQATMLTPNLPEAAVLLGMTPVDNL